MANIFNHFFLFIFLEKKRTIVINASKLTKNANISKVMIFLKNGTSNILEEISSRGFFCRFDRFGTTEAQIMSRGIRCVLTSSCTPISIAIVLMAHEWTTFLDFVFGLGAFFRALRVLMHDQSIVPNCPPIRSPFPNVSDHIIKAKVIGRKRIYWACTEAPIFFIIFLRKSASPNVGTILIVRLEFVSPRKKSIFFSCTTSIFPFCLGWETFSWKILR